MKRWRMGIIGCGSAGRQHARVMRSLQDRVELGAVADVDAGVAEASARDWQAPVWTTDWRELLTGERLDALSICLPHHLHHPVSVAASNAGLHVLMEKPLATTLAEADEMINAADHAGRRLMVAETVRFDATYLKVAELVRSGLLGELFLIRISREHEMHEYLRQRPWFLRERTGGIMYSGGIHDFELLRMLAGEIQHVYGLEGRKALPEMVGDDTSVALAGLENGAAAVIVESFSLKTPEGGVHGTVHGSRGSLWFHRDRIRHCAMDVDGQQEPVQELSVPSADAFRAEMDHFLDCLEENKEPLTSAREERKPLLAVLATYASMEQGQRVYLGDFDRSTTEGS